MFLDPKYKESCFFIVDSEFKIILEARTVKELEYKIKRRNKIRKSFSHLFIDHFLWQPKYGEIYKCEYVRPKCEEIIIGKLNKEPFIILNKDFFNQISREYIKDNLKKQRIKAFFNS